MRFSFMKNKAVNKYIRRFLIALIIGFCISINAQDENQKELDALYKKYSYSKKWFWGAVDEAQADKRVLWLNAINYYDYDEIPSFEGLGHLQGLYLNDVSKLSPSISILKNLKFFSIHSDSLKVIPKEILELTSIEYLGLSTIMTEMPDSITNLKKIKVLKLENTPLTSFYFINKLEDLTILLIDGIDLSNVGKCEEVQRKFKDHFQPTIDKVSAFYKKVDGAFHFKRLKQFLKEQKVEYQENTADCLQFFDPSTCSIVSNLDLFVRSETLITSEVNKGNIAITDIVNLEKFNEISSELGTIDREVRSITYTNEYLTFEREASDYCDQELFPDTITLKNLRAFELNNTMLTAIPSVLMLPTILKIDLDENNITHLPDTIDTLKDLSYLSIERNKLTKLPPSIKKLTKLKNLYLGGNPISEEEQENIKKMLPNCNIFF